MVLPFGHREEVSIPALLGKNKRTEQINENSAERSYGEARSSFGECEQFPQPIVQHTGVSNHSVENLPHSESLGDLSESESDSPPPQKRTKKKKGYIRGDDRNLQYLDGNKWVPAIYHHNIRAFLIQEASKNGRYTYPRERGPGRDDVTSFLESQKNWGPVRDENWAEILYVFQKEKHRKDPTYKLKYWKFNGKLVIAGHDKLPILRFRDLPDTLSSALHGRDMEAMKRTDPRIQQRDFMARMPPRHTTQAGTRRSVQTPSSIGMRMTRFRQQQGMLSWTGRDGSQTIRSALWERLPPENQRSNSIRGLRPPTVPEQLEIRRGNAGKFLNRAGKRALAPEERDRRLKKQERRLIMPEEGKTRDTEQGRDRRRLDGPDNKSRQPPPANAEQSKHQGRPDNRSMQPPPPINKQDRHHARQVRPDDQSILPSSLSVEQSRYHARRGRSESRSMEPPPKAERGRCEDRQTRLDTRSMQPPPQTARHGRPDDGNLSRRNSTNPAPGFDLDKFLTDFNSSGFNPLQTSDASIPQGLEESLQTDFDSLFEGLNPADFYNDQNYPSQSTHSSGGWNFDYTLQISPTDPPSNNKSNSREGGNLNYCSPPSPVGSFGDFCSSPKDYPSPPDCNTGSAKDHQQPYYIKPS